MDAGSTRKKIGVQMRQDGAGSGMNEQRTALALRATEAGTLLARLPASIRVPFLRPLF